MRQRQPAERFRQGLGGLPLVGAAGARHEVVGADRLGPDPDLDRRRDPAPSLGVRRDQHLAAAAGRQVGLERIGIGGIVENKQDTLALVPQPFHHGGKRGLLLVVGADPAEAHPERHQIGAHAGLGLRPDPPGRPVVAAVLLRIGGRQRGLADPTHPVQRRDGPRPRGGLERRRDGGELVVAAHEMGRHPDRDIGHREHLARKGGHRGRLARAHEFAEARARRILGHAEQLAAANMIDERRQPARLHHHEQDEAGPLLGGLPQRGVAFQGGVGRLQVLVRDDAEHMIGGIVARLHPGIDVLAALDLPFVDVGRMGERLELLADPLGPVAVAAGIGNEIIGHQPQSGAGPPRTGRNPHDRRAPNHAQAGVRLLDSCAALLMAILTAA